jgi:REP element-mobilizing transposase RayT
MPKDGMRWWHVIISTWNSWLPGDRRGFRSRDHDIHSSGDYKSPPPPDEHAGLRHYHQQNSSDPIIIPDDCRETVARTIIAKLNKLDCRVLVVSVSGMHCHFLAELPDRLEEVRQIVGQCKSKSPHAIRDRVPGRVWAFRGSFIRVRDRKHQLNTFGYIKKQKGAWIWEFTQDEEKEEESQG